MSTRREMRGGRAFVMSLLATLTVTLLPAAARPASVVAQDQTFAIVGGTVPHTGRPFDAERHSPSTKRPHYRRWQQRLDARRRGSDRRVGTPGVSRHVQRVQFVGAPGDQLCSRHE